MQAKRRSPPAACKFGRRPHRQHQSLRGLRHNIVTSTGSSQNNRLANTKERDASIGLDNHGFRYYDPSTGRYLTRDPIGYADGMNPYLSVHNNPINFIDPLGLAVDADSLPRPDDPSPPSLFESVVGGVGGFFGSIANLALGGQVAHAPPPGQTSAERRAIDETNTDAQLQGAVNLGSMVVAGPVGRAVTGGITSPLLGGYANAATQG